MADTNALVEQISGLTLLETAELIKALESKLGVSAAAPVAAAAPAGGGGAARRCSRRRKDLFRRDPHRDGHQQDWRHQRSARGRQRPGSGGSQGPSSKGPRSRSRKASPRPRPRRSRRRSKPPARRSRSNNPTRRSVTALRGTGPAVGDNSCVRPFLFSGTSGQPRERIQRKRGHQLSGAPMALRRVDDGSYVPIGTAIDTCPTPAAMGYPFHRCLSIMAGRGAGFGYPFSPSLCSCAT